MVQCQLYIFEKIWQVFELKCYWYLSMSIFVCVVLCKHEIDNFFLKKLKVVRKTHKNRHDKQTIPLHTPPHTNK